jgi:hypothetical protein
VTRAALPHHGDGRTRSGGLAETRPSPRSSPTHLLPAASPAPPGGGAALLMPPAASPPPARHLPLDGLRLRQAPRGPVALSPDWPASALSPLGSRTLGGAPAGVALPGSTSVEVADEQPVAVSPGRARAASGVGWTAAGRRRPRALARSRKGDLGTMDESSCNKPSSTAAASWPSAAMRSGALTRTTRNSSTAGAGADARSFYPAP